MYGPLKPTVTVRIPRFNIKKILRSVHRGRLCFFTDLRTNIDYFPIQHSQIIFLNRYEVCLLRGRDLPLNKIQVNYSLYRINATPYIQSLWKLSRCVTKKLTTRIQSNTKKALF